jgi:dTDP-4-dehydrorhamnose reductase
LKILLTGKNGQIGGELATLLPQLGDVVAVDLAQMDLARPAEIREGVAELRPDVIVNTAAYTAVDLAEKEEEQARIINTDAPGLLAEEAKKIGALLIHYSTDYVFDGSKKSPYLEYDATNAMSVYGKTKLEGEKAIQESGADYLILRTAWVYGSRGKNFLLTILRLASEREELRIVRDQIGAPSWSRAIAKATTEVLAKVGRKAGSSQPLHEIYHMTAAGETSWFDFAESILAHAYQAASKSSWMEIATKGRPLVARRVVPITTEEYPTPALRPAYSVLSNAKLARDFGITLPAWQRQLSEVFEGF